MRTRSWASRATTPKPEARQTTRARSATSSQCRCGYRSRACRGRSPCRSEQGGGELLAVLPDERVVVAQDGEHVEHRLTRLWIVADHREYPRQRFFPSALRRRAAGFVE